MTVLGREMFEEMVGDLGRAYQWLYELKTPVGGIDAQRRLLYEELRVRDHLFSYADAADAKDLDRLVDLFTDDAVLSTAQKKASGREQVRGFCAPYAQLNRISHHRLQNVVVRVTAIDEEAWIASYLHSVSIGADQVAFSNYGRYFGRLVQQDGRWRTADWRILIDEGRAYPRLP